jgi:hypothetical protein
MKRTQIYITDEQDRLIGERARDLGVSKADVIRRFLDRGLEIGTREDESRALILQTSGVLADYPDWPEWLRAVRGRTSDERLKDLGL